MTCSICLKSTPSAFIKGKFGDFYMKKRGFVKTNCSHIFHKRCFDNWDITCMNNERDTVCPTCKTVIYPIRICFICNNIDADAITECGHSVCSSCFGLHKPSTCYVCEQPTHKRISLVHSSIEYDYNNTSY